MANYSTYKVEDFLLDESFIEWVLHNSEKDAIFWNAWIAAHPSCVPTVNVAKKTLLALHIKPARTLTDGEVSGMIGLLQEKIESGNNVRRLSLSNIIRNPVFTYPLAAMLVIGLMIGALFFNRVSSVPGADVQPMVYAIKTQLNHTGRGILIKLADGSSVILEPGSRLSYPTFFKGHTRSVSLSGEAFFEVRKDHTHPFLVNSGDLVTRVVGTSFTVKAYSGTKEFNVIVNTGRVLVSKKNTSKVKTFKPKIVAVIPNQQLTYNVENKSLVKKNLIKPLMLSADVSKDIFTFNDTPLNKVIASIELAYNVNIVYNEKEMGGCPLTASLADEHLLEKLDLICKALNVKYYISDGQIVLQGTGCNNN